jgi:hypothetical protein
MGRQAVVVCLPTEGLSGDGGGENCAALREKSGARWLREGRRSRLALAGAAVPVQGGVSAGCWGRGGGGYRWPTPGSRLCAREEVQVVIDRGEHGCFFEWDGVCIIFGSKSGLYKGGTCIE